MVRSAQAHLRTMQWHRRENHEAPHASKMRTGRSCYDLKKLFAASLEARFFVAAEIEGVLAQWGVTRRLATED